MRGCTLLVAAVSLLGMTSSASRSLCAADEAHGRGGRSAVATNAAGDTSTDSAARSRPKRMTARERAAARRAQREAAQRQQQETEREAWLVRLEARGVEPWPQETEEVHAEALARARNMIDDVIELFPGTQLHETEHFLFVSNIPAEQVGPHIASLDRMYRWMRELYGIPAGHKVWLGGKAPIFAFLQQAEFEAFEDRFFPEARESLRSLGNIYGVCHQSDRGDVVIACFRGDNPHDFGQMLVHETSHGFNHRYRTKAPLPNWVDEGMAELIGAEMVPASRVVASREARALAQMTQQGSLGGNFFTAAAIEPWQYGVASSLNRFLLQANRQSYVHFIEGLKEGMEWPEALERAYGSTPDEMLLHYGRWIGVGNLRP